MQRRISLQVAHRQHHGCRLLYVYDSTGGVDKRMIQQIFCSPNDLRVPKTTWNPTVPRLGSLAEPTVAEAKDDVPYFIAMNSFTKRAN